MIYIQIVTEKWDPISAAIRYSTRSWASHAEFYNSEDNTTLGARPIGGVKIRYSKKDRYSKIERFSAANITDAYKWAYTQRGKGYDYSAVGGIAVDRDWHDESKWFCSELVCAAFEKIGSPILSTRPSAQAWRITPRDLLLSRQLIYIRDESVR